MIEEYAEDTEDERSFPVGYRVITVAEDLRFGVEGSVNAALKIRKRAKALHDILTRESMMAPLSQSQEKFLASCFWGFRKPTSNLDVDSLLGDCQKILNVERY